MASCDKVLERLHSQQYGVHHPLKLTPKSNPRQAIAFPVTAHALLAAVVVYINQQITSNFSLPSSIVRNLTLTATLIGLG
jgi:hypothetical protein